MFLQHFTLAEAHALLPLAKETLERVRGLMREHQALRSQLGPTAEGLASQVRTPADLPERLEALHQQVSDELSRLQEFGVQVKNLEPFLLDFPARREGRTVLLCWREGEERITHFHTVEGGFNARRPINDEADFGTAVLQ